MVVVEREDGGSGGEKVAVVEGDQGESGGAGRGGGERGRAGRGGGERGRSGGERGRGGGERGRDGGERGRGGGERRRGGGRGCGGGERRRGGGVKNCTLIISNCFNKMGNFSTRVYMTFFCCTVWLKTLIAPSPCHCFGRAGFVIGISFVFET